MKLLAFDIDGTLSEHGRPIPGSVSQRLRDLEEQGIPLAFVSGKPTFYLAGLVRGMGLDHPILIGENGCVIFDSKTLQEFHLAKRLAEFEQIEQQVISQFQDEIWLQPNRVAFTVFPSKSKDVPVVAKFIRDRLGPLEEKVLIYEHVDAVDVLPIGVDKGAALRKIKKDLHIEQKDIIAFGDSANDLPMFKESGTVFIIGNKLEFDGARKFNQIEEALDFLEGSLK
jgi:HAD superfamily hydrolase (TIGR01484 family)